MKKPWLILPLAALLAISLAITWIARGTYREFIVPQNYSGSLKIVVDRKNGSRGLSSISLFRNHVRINFPSDGILRVKHAEGLHPMAHEEWKYPDGTLLSATRTGPYPGRVRYRKNGGWPTQDGCTYEYEILTDEEAEHEGMISRVTSSAKMVMVFLQHYRDEHGRLPENLDLASLSPNRYHELQLVHPMTKEHFDWIYDPNGTDTKPVLKTPFTLVEFGDNERKVVVAYANRVVTLIPVNYSTEH